MDLFGIKSRRKRRELWAALASELGGQYFEAEGFWNPKHERIEVTLRGIAIVLDTYTVSNGKTQTAYTRVRGPFALGPGPKHRVVKKGALHSLGKLLGFQDHQIGDPEFDDLFVIKSDDAAVAHRLWSEDARHLMRVRFEDDRVRTDREGVELVGLGVWSERQQLRDGLELVAELATRDLYGSERLRQIPDAMVSRDRDGWPRVELDTGVRVVVHAEAINNRLAMVARTSDRSSIDSCTIEIADGKLVDLADQARLPPAAHVALHGVGSCTLAITAAGMSVAWRELDVDPACLRAGAELLGATAAAAPDAYR